MEKPLGAAVNRPAGPPHPAVFSVDDLTFHYPEQMEACLRHVSFQVAPGEFITLCGPSGSGKSTLLRHLKTVLAPHGAKSGRILFWGRPLAEYDQRQQAQRIGFVQQSPENQIVTDKVWHELAFGLESLGLDTPAIRGRVAEMASFFGIQTWFHKKVSDLSGGQKQLLNLASIMTMQPEVLILDEPTGQLDPIAAAEFLTTVGKINRELGATVIMTEHRLEEAFPLSDRVLVLDEGRIIADGPPARVGQELKQSGHAMFQALPAPMRVWAAVPNDLPCPVTVRDGRNWLRDYAAGCRLHELPPATAITAGPPVIELKEVWFRYERDLPDVIKGLSLSVRQGGFLALLGGNGAGKTTALSLVAGLKQAYRGRVKVEGKIGLLPQSPQALLVEKSVERDLYETFRGRGIDKKIQAAQVAHMAALCRLEDLLERHPYDLSGGEQQRAALAKVLLTAPNVLLLDEPTKGLDAEFKQTLAAILCALRQQGVTLLMVSHDVEFCAQYADSCALLFDGSIVTQGSPREFFSGNSFYTTAANRMARPLCPQAVTAADVIALCGGQVPPPPATPPAPPALPQDLPDATPEKAAKGLSAAAATPWRPLLAMAGGAAVILSFVNIMRVSDLTRLLSSEGLHLPAGHSLWYYLLIAGLLLLSLAVSRREPRLDLPLQTPPAHRRLPRRTAAAAVMILLLIPLTLFIGVYYFGGRKYYFIALLILFEAMLPFALIFEGRKPQARELVLLSALCAIGVAGRAAFFMLPNFKPVLALVVISGVACGGEAGFLVGALTMLASNVMFGQGPWTPWQMFAMGIIGFLAGILFRKGWLRRNRLSLCIFGALMALIVYGGLMNPAAALMWAQDLSWPVLLSYYVTGFPLDLVHAAATCLILWFAAEPMLEKLDRIKTKYGLYQTPAQP